MTEVCVDPRALAVELRASEAQIRMATYRAINKTLRSLSVQLARGVSQELELPVRIVMGRMREARAQLRELRGKLTELTFALPAILLGAQKTQAGVRAGRHLFRSAFIADVHEGRGRLPHRVWRRKGRERVPLSEMKVPIHDVSVEVLDKVSRETWELFSKNFDHELRFAMGEWK